MVDRTNKSHIVFVSHAFEDGDYVIQILNLLRGMGLNDTQFFCTRSLASGLPECLRTKKSSGYELHIIYVLSNYFYKSPEYMYITRIAWMLRGKETSILLPEGDFEKMTCSEDCETPYINLHDGEALEYQLDSLYDEITDEFGITKMPNHIWKENRDSFIYNVRLIADQNYKNSKLSFHNSELQLEFLDHSIGRTLFRMSYEDYVYHLICKYGIVPFPYFKNAYSEEIDNRNARTEECLYIHHIDEDKTANLSSAEYVRYKSYAPYDYQMPWRLVYCNIIEHMILHMKIMEKELSKAREERNISEKLGLGGFVLLLTQINCMFDYKYNGKSIPSEYDGYREKKFAEECEGFWIKVFLQTIEYFEERFLNENKEFDEWYGQGTQYINYIIGEINWIYNNNHVILNNTVEKYVAWDWSEYLSVIRAKGTGRT